MEQYRVNYRVELPYQPNLDMMFTYRVSAWSLSSAHGTANALLEDDMMGLFNEYNSDSIKRVTVTRAS